ncbi:MAG: TonB-dependent receptor, partial [Proteobacteria bacterium]|nr:TonB-dependent receptor [Pseudomonadota bacterium]
SLGSHYLDAENRHSYPGHDLANLRVAFAIDDHWSVTARLNNLFDTSYADRADYAFGDYRYFPGRGRELFVRLQYSRPAYPNPAF